MGYTIDQYQRLITAIAQGARRVKYADKEVEYLSLDEMNILKAQMEKELGLSAAGIKTKYASFSRGLNK